ncbi:MAG TPA: ABC transporter ATP-binding protein [Steroidobacteraceae bacterium]|nr:ABC transporter ATP-binding protein [Steroidobacteraceae bacterium]
MSAAAIDLQNVEFSWPSGARVLAIPQLTIQPRERVFLHGPSGSGKSTLLGIVGGIFQPQAGHVHVLGTSLTRLSGAARDRFRGEQIGFIFQMFNLIPYLSVLENVLLPLGFSAGRAQRMGGADAPAEAKRLLSSLGLSEAGVSQRRVTDLSVGQQQRVAAARALIGRPPILVADEPTSSLDAQIQADFLRLLMTECMSHGTTLLFVSHDLTMAPKFDRTIRIRDINRAAAPTF